MEDSDQFQWKHCLSVSESCTILLIFHSKWPHCYLPDWTFKKWGLSSFGFQSFQRWIGTQKNKNFSIPVRYCWGPNYQGKAIPAHSKKTPKWHFLTPAWNLNLFGQSAKKVPFWDFIQNVSQALSKWINGIISKSPPRNLKKNLFV
jgi:hypothetical protein